MGNLNGTSLFAGIISGLNGTFSNLADSTTGEVTLESIAKAKKNNNSTNGSLNQTFASYIQENFTSIDADNDGEISSSELSDMTNKISTTGLTATQLTQLGTASGLSTETLEQVLEHFSEIDANHDGKVTTSEISAYNVTEAREKKRVEFEDKAMSGMSVFYGSSSSSESSDSDTVEEV